MGFKPFLAKRTVVNVQFSGTKPAANPFNRRHWAFCNESERLPSNLMEHCKLLNMSKVGNYSARLNKTAGSERPKYQYEKEVIAENGISNGQRHVVAVRVCLQGSSLYARSAAGICRAIRWRSGRKRPAATAADRSRSPDNSTCARLRVGGRVLGVGHDRLGVASRALGQAAASGSGLGCAALRVSWRAACLDPRELAVSAIRSSLRSILETADCRIVIPATVRSILPTGGSIGPDIAYA